MKRLIDAFRRICRSLSRRERANYPEFINQFHDLKVAFDQRSATLESIIQGLDRKIGAIESLVRFAEARTHTLEYEIRQVKYALNYHIDLYAKDYVERLTGASLNSAFDKFPSKTYATLETEFPLAIGSYDHIKPESTIEGVTRPTSFVVDCIRVMGRGIRCLDLGVGAAGLVYEFQKHGVYALGIDGSDHCRQNLIGYWPLLNDTLYTCDITKLFKFRDEVNGSHITFDLVTSWEVLEHIQEQSLDSVFENVLCNLSINGYFVGSISSLEYSDEDGMPYHLTVKKKDWWISKFKMNGLRILDSHPFNESTFCRGNGPRYQDFHNYKINEEAGFLFVAQRIL